jgi:hypothetical protein
LPEIDLYMEGRVLRFAQVLSLSAFLVQHSEFPTFPPDRGDEALADSLASGYDNRAGPVPGHVSSGTRDDLLAVPWVHAAKP